VTRAQPVEQLRCGGSRDKLDSGSQYDPVASDDKCPVDRRKLLDRFFDLRVENVPLLLGITVDWRQKPIAKTATMTMGTIATRPVTSNRKRMKLQRAVFIDWSLPD